MYIYNGKPIHWNGKSTGAWYSLVNGEWREVTKDSPLAPAEYVTYRDLECPACKQKFDDCSCNVA